MMFIDAIWMGVLSWYIAKIWPSEFGTHQPFYFPCLPSYWKTCFGIAPSRNSVSSRLTSQEVGLPSVANVERVTENLVRQVEDGTCVDILDLCKEFKTTTGKKVAVDHLNLTMYSGQITALLGHNGAGKVRPMKHCNYCRLLAADPH
jgi:ABC-type multidrug transport system fused ATPase/permease subunit